MQSSKETPKSSSLLISEDIYQFLKDTAEGEESLANADQLKSTILCNRRLMRQIKELKKYIRESGCLEEKKPRGL